jgi:hypothetical protein
MSPTMTPESMVDDSELTTDAIHHRLSEVTCACWNGHTLCRIRFDYFSTLVVRDSMNNFAECVRMCV